MAVVAAMTATMIVAVATVAEDTVAMAAADVTMTAIVGTLATKIAIIVPMDVVTTTGLVVLIVTPQAETTVTVAAEMTVVVVGATTTASVLVMEATEIQRLLAMLASRMEVDLMTIALTIGTLVVRVRSANLLRCGALCQITRPRQPQSAGYTSVKIALGAFAFRRQAFWQNPIFLTPIFSACFVILFGGQLDDLSTVLSKIVLSQ